MILAARERELNDAWRVLFGAMSPAVTWDKARWKDELRRAFRRRALETHPDRANVLGRRASELGDEFRRVGEAFELLAAAGRPPRFAPAPTGTATRMAGAAASSPVPLFYRGAVPRRRLRLSEYLFYTGRVPWREHMESLRWQRCHRPTLGQIAVTSNFLSSEQMLELFRHHQREGRGEPFGEFAHRFGYLTYFQLLAVLGKQRALGYPVGRFFLDHGLCGPAEIDAVVDWQRRYATRYTPSSPR